jgi:hypothetical protein
MLSDHLLQYIMKFLDMKALLIMIQCSRQAWRCAERVSCELDFTGLIVPNDYTSRFRGARKLVLSRSTISPLCLSIMLRSMVNLQELDLSFFDGPGWTAIELAGYFCPGITHLNIAQYRYASNQWPNNSTLQIIADQYIHIVELDLSECIGISCSGLQSLSICSELTSLNLSRCTNVTEQGLVYLSKCTKLKRLSISECVNVSGVGIVHIAQACSDLQYLDMSMCPKVNDGVLAYFGTKLTHLNLHQFRHVDKQGLANVTTSITHLNLGQPQWLRVGNIIDQDLQSCARCIHLTHLDLSMCSYVTDAGIRHLARKCHGLARLNLCACAGITDNALSFLGEGCPALTHIDVGYCWITDVGVSDLVAGCTLLTHISLQKCIYITDESIFAIARHSSNLRHINVRNCTFVSKHGLRRLCERCTHLEFIDATLCWISDESWVSKTCVAVTHLAWDF